MNNTAAHVVDRVIPEVPVRQWVLSLPFDLRARAAYDATVLSTIIRAFANALSARHRSWARAMGLGKSEFAAITFVQRFGSSLNLNVHLHVVVVDGAFSRDEANALLFTPAPAPTRADRMTVLVDLRRQLAKQPVEDDAVTPTLAACAQLALQRGDVRVVTEDAIDPPELAAPVTAGAVEAGGFNLEASVRIEADDDFGREHLLRYCARPPLSLARLTQLSNGMLAYRIKQLRNRGSKVRYMTPLELLARLAALIPPPRHPLVRFHGAFAPRSSWRRDVVPKPREQSKKPAHEHALIPQTQRLAPNVLSVRHWGRLHAGALVAATTRIDWATLMRRTFDTDVLACPKCEGRLHIVAIIDDPNVAGAILAELHIPRARSPTPARAPTTLYLDHDHPDP